MRLSTTTLLAAFFDSFVVQAIALSSQGQVHRKAFLGQVSSLAIGASVEALVTNPDQAFAAVGGDRRQSYVPPANSQTGKVHVITGASSGLGLESAKRIAAAGATVVLTSRTSVKGETAVQQVREYLSSKSIENPNVFHLTLDLNDFESIKSFPERYNVSTSNKRIDVLMNNAGVTGIPQRELTKDGFEKTFQSNHLGPFMLTALLFPYLNRKGARIINVSSAAHLMVTDANFLDNLNGEKSYAAGGWEAYGLTKLENILFTQELQRRADAVRLEWLTATALHPGVVGTDIWRTTPLVGEKSTLTSKLFYGGILTIEEGANTQVCLATESDETLLSAKGRYYDENGSVGKLTKLASDPTKALELWSASERMSGVEFKVL